MALLVGAALLVSATTASAQPSDEALTTARALYTEGEQRFAAQDYRGAIDAFTRANAIIEHPRNHYNIAKSYERLGDGAACVASYERYLDGHREREGQFPVDALDVRASIARCKLEMRPRVRVTSRPAGANVYIDDESVLLGQTPFESSVGPGKHTLFLEMPGYERLVVSFNAETSAANQPTVLDYTLVAGPADTQPMPPETAGMSWKGYLGIGAIGLGLGLGVGGFVAGQQAADLYNDTDDFETASLIEGIGYIGGGALLATGVLLVILEATDSGDTDVTSPAARLLPVVGPTPGGAVVGANLRW